MMDGEYVVCHAPYRVDGNLNKCRVLGRCRVVRGCSLLARFAFWRRFRVRVFFGLAAHFLGRFRLPGDLYPLRLWSFGSCRSSLAGQVFLFRLVFCRP